MAVLALFAGEAGVERQQNRVSDRGDMYILANITDNSCTYSTFSKRNFDYLAPQKWWIKMHQVEDYSRLEIKSRIGLVRGLPSCPGTFG